jgi:hypothetical protein
MMAEVTANSRNVTPNSEFCNAGEPDCNGQLTKLQRAIRKE